MVFGGAVSNTLPQWFPSYLQECDSYLKVSIFNFKQFANKFRLPQNSLYYFLKSPKRSFKGGLGKTNYGFVIGERYMQPYAFQGLSHCLVAEVDKSDGPPAMLALVIYN